MILNAWEESHGQRLVSDNEISSEDAATQKNEEGLQAESDNADVIRKIEEKKKEIANKKGIMDKDLAFFLIGSFFFDFLFFFIG